MDMIFVREYAFNCPRAHRCSDACCTSILLEDTIFDYEYGF